MSTSPTPTSFAGFTLAQLAAVVDMDARQAPVVRAELEARVARQGKSAKNAQKALERMDAGASVAIPAPAPKAPKASAPAASARKVTNPNLPIVAANARAKGVVSERQAFALVAAIGRDAGYSIPRWITAGSKGRTIARKA